MYIYVYAVSKQHPYLLAYIIRISIGQYVGKRNSKLPYSKIDDYGISIDGLPPGISLKHPSSYGKNAMKLILSNKHLLKLNS